MESTVRILPSEHVFIAGKTGSGKSYLAERYLAGFDQVVMLDTKGEMWKRWKDKDTIWHGVDPEQITMVERFADLEKAKTPKIIYTPPHQEMSQDVYNAFFEWCYYRENTTIWVDEALEVSPNPTTIPDYYRAVLTRGRFLNVAVWSLTQRPKGISPLIMSQCTHFFIFNLRLDQDRKKLVDVTGCPEFEENPGGHNFWYYREDWPHPVLAKLVET